MKPWSSMLARPKTLAAAGAVTVGVVAITTMAFTYDGFPTTKVDLNDGGVWITKTSSLLVGHFNHESTVLDGGLRTTGENFDILQDEKNILVVDESASTVTAIDPARVSLGDTSRIPSAAKVALGHQTAAILDPKSGPLIAVKLHVLTRKSLGGIETDLQGRALADGRSPVAGRDAAVPREDAFNPQPGRLFGRQVRGEAAVRTHHAVPRHVVAVLREHPADQAGRAQPGLLGDLPVAAHLP